MRREHVFEDSFYQLRMRSTDEMRAKLKWVLRWGCAVLWACCSTAGRCVFPLPTHTIHRIHPPNPTRHHHPACLCCRYSVVFTGEEGVDAGGVTREWYAVMSREMFNPQFSLFQPVPEGGTTFQVGAGGGTGGAGC